MKTKVVIAILRWIEAWADLANAIVAVVTFGQYWPGWDMKVRYWTAKFALNRLRGLQVEKRKYAAATVKPNKEETGE